MLHAPWVAGGQGKFGMSHESALCAWTVVRMRKRALSRTMDKGKEYDCAFTMANRWLVGRL